MLHLPDIEITLPNLISISQKQGCDADKGQMSQTHEKPGPELAESSQEQVLTNGEARHQGQRQLGMKQSLKMERNMPHMCPQWRIGQKPGTYIRFSKHL